MSQKIIIDPVSGKPLLTNEVIGGGWIYPSGDWTPFFNTATGNNSTINTVANQVNIYLHEVKDSVELSRVGINITGSTAVGNLVIGIYKINSDYEAILVGQSDPTALFDTNIAGSQSVALQSNVNLTKGIYGFGYLSDVSGVGIRSFFNAQIGLTGDGIITTAPLYNRLSLGSAYSSTMPSSLSGATKNKGNVCMGIFFEIA